MNKSIENVYLSLALWTHSDFMRIGEKILIIYAYFIVPQECDLMIKFLDLHRYCFPLSKAQSKTTFLVVFSLLSLITITVKGKEKQHVLKISA